MKRIAFLRRLLLLAALGFAVFLILSVRPQGTRPQLGTVDVAETLVKEIGAVRDRMRFRDFQFEEDRGDGEGFRLRASEAIGYRETGEDYFRLKDVVVEFRGKDPRAKGLVVGAPRAEFKQSTRAMKVFDGVFVERQGLSLSALSFRYDPTKKAFTSDGRVTVVQGRMIGLADKGILESLNGSIVLDGAVQIGGHDAGGKPISVRAGNVTILKDGSLAATNGVIVKTGEILLRSQKADRGLVAGGESIRASGNVVFFLLPEETANRATPISAEGDGIEIVRDATGPLKSMVLEKTGDLARIDLPATLQSPGRRLWSSRFEARFAEGKLAEIAVPEPLRGEEAPVPLPDRKAGFRTVEASKARISFQPDGKSIDIAAFDGPVKASDALRKTMVEGSSASFRGASNSLIVSGNASLPALFSDPTATIRSRVLTYHVADETLDAEGAVRASFQGASTATLPGSRSSEPYFSESESLRLLMKKKELVLTGSVRAWQRENVLRAGKLTLSDLDRRVLAEGSVKATFRRQGGTSAVTKSLLNSGEIINATADRLLHTEASQVVRLEGSSSVVSGQWKLDADVSEFHLGPDSTIQYAESKGGVVMEDRQTSRRGEGSKAIWMPQNEVVTLEGNPAKAVDGQGNRVEGALLLFRPGKTRVDVETASGIRTEGVFRPEGP